ncbi:MAG: serine protease [bacterium]
MLIGCAGNQSNTQIKPGLSLLSEDLKRELYNVSQSVVGVNSKIKYEIQKFTYLEEEGRLVVDPKSPLKYKLASNGDSGITKEKEDKTLSGGGLLIDYQPETSKYTILTSSHLVAPQDTTDVYYLDEYGVKTDVLFARYIVKDVIISVRLANNWRVEADLIAKDSAVDLAIIEVQTDSRLGYEFRDKVGYDLNLSWGDWVFLFGFPKGIKQMTGGWVSQAPYRGTLAVDAVVRFGFSGGPVFGISKSNAKLIFAGVVKSVPRSTLDYIAPDGSLPMGFRLSAAEVERLVVRKEIMVDYGTAYFVNARTIKEFFVKNRSVLNRAGIRLHPKYFGN